MTDTAQPSAPPRSMGIRFESIGGLGAHAAGQILATAAVLRLGLNGAHFSSYGSEKKGSPVKSYIRLEPPDTPIRSSAPIDSPDCVCVFHNALIHQPHTIAGLKAGGVLIYNGHEGDTPDALARVPKDARIIRVDALRIAIETRSRPNAVFLGTLCAALDLLDADAVLEAFSDEFTKKHPEAVESNTAAFKRGMTEFEELTGAGQADDDVPVFRPSPVWGYETAPIGGVLPTPGNTVTNDLSMSRTGFMPVFHKDKCIHCGLCDLVCPDFCIAWEINGDNPVPESTRMLGIDYQYCKGCQRCVETCPSDALTREVEEPGMAERLRVPVFPQNENGANRV